MPPVALAGKQAVDLVQNILALGASSGRLKERISSCSYD